MESEIMVRVLCKKAEKRVICRPNFSNQEW